MSLEYEIPTAIGPGGTWAWEWESLPIEKTWGIHQFNLQFVNQGNEFPVDPIRITIVVIRQELADKKDELEEQIRKWIEQGIEDIEKMILTWIERQLQDWVKQICPASISIIPLMALISYRRRSKYQQANQEELP
jgi:hypothetical protein